MNYAPAGTGSRRGKVLLILILAVIFPPANSHARASSPAVIEGSDALKERIRQSRGVEGVLFFSDRGLLKEVYLPLMEQGVIRTLELVVPSENPLEDKDLNAWRSYVSFVQPGADNAFHLKEGTIEGGIGGLSVTVHPFGTWKGPRASVTAVMDMRFIPGVYKDEARTPMVELAQRLLFRVREQGVEFPRMILWTGGRGDIPLFFGYLYKLVPRLLRTPALFEKSLPPKWQELSRAERLNFLSLYEEAEVHYNRFLRYEPGEPSVLFKLAMMDFVDDRVERGLRHMLGAYRSDPYYIRAYSDAAFRLFHDGELGSAERVVRAGLHLSPGNPPLLQNLGRILLEQAKKAYPEGAAAGEARFAEAKNLGLDPDILADLQGEWERFKSSPKKEESRRPARSGGPVPPH